LCVAERCRPSHPADEALDDVSRRDASHPLVWARAAPSTESARLVRNVVDVANPSHDTPTDVGDRSG
jgi:hypothetical protein